MLPCPGSRPWIRSTRPEPDPPVLPRTDSPPLDPSSSEARRELADELAKSEYTTGESPLRRALRSFIDWFTSLFEGDAEATAQGWWGFLGIAALALIIALAIWAIIRLQPARRAARTVEGGIFEESGVSATEYRRRAQAARQGGDFSAAVLDAYRAIATGAVERHILDDLPGATAREISVSLTRPFPDEVTALRDAALAFDAVRYGNQVAGVAVADAVLALDQRIASAVPRLETPA